MQELAWGITLLVIAIIAVVFIRVVILSGGRREYDGVQTSAYRVRSGVFWLLIIIGVAGAWLTLRELPYSPPSNAATPQVVNAVGYQWYWEFDEDTVVAGQPVEFHVTAEDVNHGFGIYDEETRLVAQVQAMPGYVNVLRYTFEQPGIYRILCLEYCGIAHHDMVGEIEVTAP